MFFNFRYKFGCAVFKYKLIDSLEYKLKWLSEQRIFSQSLYNLMLTVRLSMAKLFLFAEVVSS